MKLKDVKFVRDATNAATEDEALSVIGKLAKQLAIKLSVSRRAKVSFSVEIEFDEVSTSPQSAEVAPTVADQAEPKP